MPLNWRKNVFAPTNGKFRDARGFRYGWIKSVKESCAWCIKADPLVTTGEAAEEPQRWSFYGRSAFEANWKGEKAQSECLTCCVLSHFSCVRLFEIQRTLAHQTLHGIRASGKKIVLKYHLLLFYTTVNHFLIGLWYVTRSRFYMTTGHDQLSTKTNLPQKEVTVTVWWSAACLIHYSFLNPSKTIASEKHAQQKVSKTARPAAGVGQQKGPNSSPRRAWPHIT